MGGEGGCFWVPGRLTLDRDRERESIECSWFTAGALGADVGEDGVFAAGGRVGAKKNASTLVRMEALL